MHATAGHRDCTHRVLHVVCFLLFSLVLPFVDRNFCCCSSLMAFRSTGLENSFIQRGTCLKQSFSILYLMRRRNYGTPMSTKSRVGFFFSNWLVEKIHQVPTPYEDHVSWRSGLQFCPGNLLDLLNWSVAEREFFPSFLGASSFSRRSAVLQPEPKNKKQRVTIVRGEVKESQSTWMARAPDFEVYMFQLLFPLPIFFLTDPLLWFLHEVWSICFWQSVERGRTSIARLR